MPLPEDYDVEVTTTNKPQDEAVTTTRVGNLPYEPFNEDEVDTPEHADVDAPVGAAEAAAKLKSDNLHSEPESDAEEAVKAIDEQHREVMVHIMDAAIAHVVKVESTAAAMVAAGLLNGHIIESKEELTSKILNTHRKVEARALLTAACTLLRLAGGEMKQEDVATYGGLATALAQDNAKNFEESFSKAVDDMFDKMSAEGEPEIVIP